MAENQQPITYNLIPKAVLSLKCLQELPIIVVLMYQLYKQFVHQVRMLMIQIHILQDEYDVGGSGYHCMLKKPLTETRHGEYNMHLQVAPKTKLKSFQEVAEFIPLIMTTITLQPTPAQRSHKDFNKEVFADFVHAQVRSSLMLILT